MPEPNQGGRCPAIEYAPEVLETIRAAVVDGFYKLAHGGLEVGGVLFGRRSRSGDKVEIRTSRPIACQYAHGPSFKLSEADLAGLANLLESVRADPALAGMIPVGWYHSHTRSEPALAEGDLEFHERFFPEVWQVALVLRPERFGPTRAVFHIRDAQGVLRPEPERSLEPLPREAKPARSVPPRRQPEPEPERSEPPPAARPSNRLPWLLFALAWLVAAASTAIAVRSYWWPQPPPPLELTLFDINGQLSIQWDKSAPGIREAESGLLEIQDGDQRRALELNAEQVRKGSVLYSRQSGSVVARLQASLPHGRATEGMARFVGEPVRREPAPETAAASAAASAEIERLSGEVKRLESALAKQNQRNRDLEAAIAALRKRLAAGP